MNRKLLWLVPLVLVLAIAAAILALPGFVASRTHRGNIEALASSLTGRDVHIGGALSLSLVPGPQLTAADVTITGPRHETITARSLTLGISVAALLHGRLSAQTLTLDAPTIAFPWPLPGGPKAIAPPGWLTALHARINHGVISLGAARFSNVDADVFTSAKGMVAAFGTGTLLGHGISLKLALNAADLQGGAPVAMNASSGKASMNFSGRLNASSALSGTVEIATPQLSGSADILASAGSVSATGLQFRYNKAAITGTANVRFAPLAISAVLNAQNLDIPDLSQTPAILPAIPIALSLNAANLSLAGHNIPSLQTRLDISPSGVTFHALRATLPANAVFIASGQLSAASSVQGQASLTSPNLPGLLSTYHLSAPDGWNSAEFSATLSGSAARLSLADIAGRIGNAHLTGTLILTGTHAAGALDFDRLDLLPLITWLGHRPAFKFSADGQITAARADFGPIPLQHLLLDGELDGGLNLRRISAGVFGGIASGSVALDPAGQVTAARGFLSLPSAAPLAALLPASWQPPPELAAPRLDAGIFAAGKPSALSTSLIGTLGDFTITAAPVLNLGQLTATGPLTLRHPDAIAAMQTVGFPHGLAWPGPGSIALRASFTASAERLGLPDFVLSLGALTANGRLLADHGVFSGQIDAGTLALPPVAANEQIPWALLTGAQGKISLNAAQVLYAGKDLLSDAAASIALAPGAASFTLTHATLAGGKLAGMLDATLAANTPPALRLNFSAQNITAARLSLPLPFPYKISSGALAGAGNLTASGYSPKIWAATLGGNASLTSTGGAFTGFSLANLSLAFTKKVRAAALEAALASGNTGFDSLSLGAKFAQGNATLTTASLTGPQGSAIGTGSIDIFDRDVALHLQFAPILTPPVVIGATVLGSWAAPKQIPQLKPALAWQRPAPPP